MAIALSLRLCLELFAFFHSIFQRTYQVKRGFGVFIHLAIHNGVERADRIFDAYKHTFQTGELLGNEERLG